MDHDQQREQEFTVTGRFKARDGWQAFEKAVAAPTPTVAVERTYAAFGSQHGLNRSQVDVDTVDGTDAAALHAEAEA